MRRSAVRLVGNSFLIALLGYGLVIAFAYVFQREAVFPRHFVTDDPFHLMVGEQFERVTITTSDGESLKAYWKPPENNAPVVVSFHGNGSVPEPLAVRFGHAPWSDAGFGVLTFAYRGYPGSTGRPTEEGLIEDGESVLRFMRERAPHNPLVLHGHSLGTGVAVAMAERHQAKALILEAPFSSLPDVVALTMPLLPGQLLLDTFFSQRRIANAQADTIVIVHGERDTVVPAALGRRLFSAAPHGVFLSVETADHLSLRGIKDPQIFDLVVNGYPPEPIADGEPVNDATPTPPDQA